MGGGGLGIYKSESEELTVVKFVEKKNKENRSA